MIKVVKDGFITYAKDNGMLAIYLSNGWVLAKEKPEKKVEVEVEVENEMTKKQLQKKLDELKVDYKPQENKSALMDKLTKAVPSNNFDDGLLKG
jgi:hypothetical protein